jgi:hypothetical protein
MMSNETTEMKQTPTQQVGTSAVLDAALNLYEPPFNYHCTYIFDAKHRMVMNVDELKESELILRGWGRIQYEHNPKELHDAVGQHVANALTEYWEKHLGNSDSFSDVL